MLSAVATNAFFLAQIMVLQFCAEVAQNIKRANALQKQHFSLKRQTANISA
jgi:hypothetical protein